MGECNFFLKARFATAEHALVASSSLTELLRQGEAAYNFWQASRTLPDENLPASKAFWSEFQTRFPIVSEYLQQLTGIEDWVNELAGHLGSLVDPHLSRRADPQATLTQEDDALLLKLTGIWHFTDMELLERYCRRVLGVTAVGSCSEEEFDSEETFEDWEYFEAIEAFRME